MSSRTDLSVGGFAPLSTVDWPGQLVATVFTRGCPWNCHYCHNPHLLRADEACTAADDGVPTWSQVLAFLATRVGLLDGVVFTGGEPLAQPALPAAMRSVSEMGFEVALHTGGSLPERLREVLGLTDWVGFDVKAPFPDYERVTRVPNSGESALASLRALVTSGVAFEARTTVHPDLTDEADLARLATILRREGVTRWALQAYRADGVRPGLDEPLPAQDLAALAARLSAGFESLGVR